MGVTITELAVADDPKAWRAAGFEVTDDGCCRVGALALRLVGPGPDGTRKGVVGWSLTDLPDGCAEVDGIVTTAGDLTTQHEPGVHPNGVVDVDHVVLMTPHLARTSAALAAIGVDPRRERDAEMGGQPVRQVFYRLGPVILEVVGSPEAEGDGPSRIWGITHTVADIDATAAFFGDGIGRVKDAVQAGRRIATLRHRDLGVSVATAFISAPPLR